ncbi:MAG: hypothetical protein LBG98_02995 [Puniceicoccales bacterium]|nr:hypothetical protein [Puniceicoccales bacterium]
MKNQVKFLEQWGQKFSIKPEALLGKIDQLCEKLNQQESELRCHRQHKSLRELESLCAQAEPYAQDAQILCVYVDCREPKELRSLAASLLGRLKNGIILLLATSSDGRNYHMVFTLSPKWVEKGIYAHRCLLEVMAIWNAKCGGKDDIAMGGGMPVSLGKPEVILGVCRSKIASLLP